MGLRAIIGAAIVLGSGGVLAFAACSGKKPLHPSPAASESTPAPIEPQPTSPVGTSATTSSPQERLEAAVATVRACQTPAALITNRPESGVVFNNAMTSADAGSIDRGQAVIDALGSQTEAFRCCFDAWFANHRDDEQRVMLLVELAPDGSVKTARADPKRSTIDDDVVLACLAAVAGDVSYPTSPSDQPTVVEYPLVARAGAVNEQGSKPR